METKNYSIETLCVTSTEEFVDGEPRVFPIVQSTTYNYKDTEYIADLFDLKKLGHMYSRISNPTVGAFENKMAALEGGVGAVGTSSGQGALQMAILTICDAGAHIVASSTLYGGNITLLGSSLAKLGITTTFVSPEASADEIKSYFQENTKALFAETVGNPKMNVLDLEKFGKIAKEQGVPFIVDNTLATPYLCRPIEYGANIITHSATKYIDGQATCVGGVVVDAGNFDWTNGKFPGLVEPDATYHGLSYTESFGNLAYIIKARTHILRDFGQTMSAFNAFIYNRGLETLHLRMERHGQNALEVAKYLQNHNKVAWVEYSHLEASDSYKLAQKYLPKGGNGVVLFGLKGGHEAGIKLGKVLNLINVAVHIGDSRTAILHPASSSHRQLSAEDQIKAGVSPEAVRINVGIENVADIIKDLENGLKEL